MREPRLIAQSWLRKSDESQDPFDSFIALWIAFNALYSQYGDGSDARERDQIRDWVQHDLAAASQEEVRAALQGADSQFFGTRIIRDVRGWSGDTRSWATGLKSRDRSPLYRATSLLWILYRVRCNLFHGSKQYDSDSDHEVTLRARNSLQQILRLVLEPGN